MILIDGNSLNLEKVVKVAREREKIEFSQKAINSVIENRKLLEQHLLSGSIVYGVNTGYGELIAKKISEKDLIKLQENLIKSHSVGVGHPLNQEYVRAAMLVRLNTLLKGYSGIRIETLNLLKDMLNKDVIPFVPEKGSVGASGDLAPLAHMVLVMIGEGSAYYKNKLYSGKEALSKVGLAPIKLSYKEGVALINGTSVMTGIAALVIYDSYNLWYDSLIASGMSLEALRGNDDAFESKLLSLRPHKGQMLVGQIIKTLAKNSENLTDSKKTRIQDAYSLRCIPQVMGPVYDTLEFVKNIVETELNSVTDNPVILSKVYSGGNFHGEYVGFAMDYLAIALSEMASISERRVARLVDAKLSGLAPFLTSASGLNSGMMLLQYTAASLVSENKVLAHPATVDSIPTSANQEDHVSMGTIAARKAAEILKNVKYVIAIEYLVSAQALEFLKLKISPTLEKIHLEIRKSVKPLKEDRVLRDDLLKIEELMSKQAFIKIIDKKKYS